MGTIDIQNTIKGDLIEKILSTDNEKLLSAIATIFDLANKEKEEKSIKISETQEQILEYGLKDYEAGNIISQEELDRIDAEWMK
jgi:predicted transcriptional regulator